MATEMTFIIPYGPDERIFPAVIDDLAHFKDCEILLAATCPPSASDKNRMEAVGHVAWLISAPGRALQQNSAAKQANGKWLCFLHADSRISSESLAALKSTIKYGEPNFLYYFGLSFHDDEDLYMRWNKWGVRFRIASWGVPYGDQGLTIAKEKFLQLDGFQEHLSCGEDHDFVWRALLRGMVLKRLAATMSTSARKYQNNGWLRTSIQHNLQGMRQAWRFGWKKRLGRKSFS